MDNKIISQEKEKINKFKITTNYSTDRNPAMKEIMWRDQSAEFKTNDNWSFRVKTKLSSRQICEILAKNKEPFKIKKIWFF